MRDYVISQKQGIVNLLWDGEIVEVAVETGKALHAIQDFYSHSIFVELNEIDRTNAMMALADPAIRMPSNVEMYGFWVESRLKPLLCNDNGGHYLPEDPLKYSHSDHNKDELGGPVGRPKDPGWANGNATQHTIESPRQTWVFDKFSRSGFGRHRRVMYCVSRNIR